MDDRKGKKICWQENSGIFLPENVLAQSRFCGRFAHRNSHGYVRALMAGIPNEGIAGYAVAREAAAWVNLSARGRLKVTGADRARFLHNQCTNDIKRLQPGEGRYVARTASSDWLTKQALSFSA